MYIEIIIKKTRERYYMVYSTDEISQITHVRI